MAEKRRAETGARTGRYARSYPPRLDLTMALGLPVGQVPPDNANNGILMDTRLAAERRALESAIAFPRSIARSWDQRVV
jgi:hypothetical protein